MLTLGDDDDNPFVPRCFDMRQFYHEYFGNFLKTMLTNFQARRALIFA